MQASARPTPRAAAVVALGILVALPAQARDASHSSGEAVAAPEEASLTPEESALLGQALDFDFDTLSGASGTLKDASGISPRDAKPTAKPLRLPNAPKSEGLAVTRNGSTVVVKQPLPWDAKIGADLGVASNAAPMVVDRPIQPFAPKKDGASGAAWASLGVTRYATVDVRVDPAADTGRLAGTLSRSVPLGDRFSVTLQNSTSVTENFGTSVPDAPAGLPVIALPQNNTAAAGPTQVWGNEQKVKFDILSTGTSFGAGVVNNSNDTITRNILSANQRLLGPLHVTTAIKDVGQTNSSKSITAGFKLNW